MIEVGAVGVGKLGANGKEGGAEMPSGHGFLVLVGVTLRRVGGEGVHAGWGCAGWMCRLVGSAGVGVGTGAVDGWQGAGMVAPRAEGASSLARAGRWRARD